MLTSLHLTNDYRLRERSHFLLVNLRGSD